MTEYPIARMYAGAVVQKVYCGNNEIMKELISLPVTPGDREDQTLSGRWAPRQSRATCASSPRR